MKKMKWIGGLLILSFLLIGCQSQKNNVPPANNKEVKENSKNERVEETSKEETSNEETKVEPEAPSVKEATSNQETDLSVDQIVSKHLEPQDKVILLKDEAPNIIIIKVKLADPSHGEKVGKDLLSDLKNLGKWQKGKVIVEDHDEYFMKF